jgi:hypothetical protein
MSSASIPAPRTSTGSSSRQGFFWPILIYFISVVILAFYQVESLESQLAEVTNAYDQLDPQVKESEYEKAKFYAVARDLLRMAPKHPAADKIVTETGIRRLAQVQPVLMSLDQPVGFTNTAPTQPAAPGHAPAPSPSPLIQ